jgi:signal transduction histidine kinase
MFHQARLKLTLLYSVIFLLLFWSLSYGIYSWMNQYFGDTKVNNNSIHVRYEKSLLAEDESSLDSPSDIVMDELRNIILFLDAILFFSVPTITWFLTGRTLLPVQKAHEREKQFLTDASHDLRTPLSILSGEMELTLRKERTKEEYKKTLQSNKEEIDYLVSLVENMLFFARDGKQKSNLQKKPVDLTDLLAERSAAFQHLANQKKQQLSFYPSEEALDINGNQQQLKRLFSCLLDNAVKYTPQKGKITMTCLKEKDNAIITITDTGIGIPQESQQKVFDRFFRETSSRTEKGYGLGLSIAKEIVEYHDGKIQLHSKIGKGTTVTLSFALSKQTPGRNQS